MAQKGNMPIIEYHDTVSGKLATLFLKYNGQNLPLAQFKTLEARMGKSKTNSPRLGTTADMHRTGGWEGTGDGTMYYGTSVFLQMANLFNKQGKDIYVDLVVENDDPTSTLGTQGVLLKHVNFDEIPLAKFDVTSDEPLEMDLNFTFDDFEVLSTFTHPGAGQLVNPFL